MVDQIVITSHSVFIATQSQENGGYPVERVMRTCGFVGDETQSQYSKSVAESSRRVVYTCFGDGCNSGTGLHRGTGEAVLAMTLLWATLIRILLI